MFERIAGERGAANVAAAEDSGVEDAPCSGDQAKIMRSHPRSAGRGKGGWGSWPTRCGACGLSRAGWPANTIGCGPSTPTPRRTTCERWSARGRPGRWHPAHQGERERGADDASFGPSRAGWLVKTITSGRDSSEAAHQDQCSERGYNGQD
jgi:hypothetical protein